MIINISSRAGLVGLPMLSLYCAAKFALADFSESLAYELASQNIIVKIVEPSGGITNTNFSELMGREQAQGVSLADCDIFVAHISSVFAGMQFCTLFEHSSLFS
jgi:short-subunit dehydrogenase